MDARIKDYADSGNARALKYIFADSLDIDPTFETYADDYEYCKNVNGFIVPYMRLFPLIEDPSEWNESYWARMKVDLINNFSEERFNHMMEVVKVTKKDQIEQIKKQREEMAEKFKSYGDVHTVYTYTTPDGKQVREDPDIARRKQKLAEANFRMRELHIQETLAINDEIIDQESDYFSKKINRMLRKVLGGFVLIILSVLLMFAVVLLISG